MKNLTTPNKVQELQRKLYLKSKKEKGFRYYSLYDKVYRKDVLQEAWRRVKANKGSAGIDGETIQKIAGDEEKFLQGIQEELKARQYRAEVVKRVWIPKSNGKLRPLGIPTVKDRVVQMAVKIVIEPIFEADFEDNSYGFRPKRSAQQAVGEVKKYLNWGLVNVVDADIDNFFGKINHGKLMGMIRKRVIDKNILNLIKLWLKSGVMEEGKIRNNTTGTPQGGVISPLLGNIYLNELDKQWREKGHNRRGWMNAHLVRYADDLVILTNRRLSQPLSALKKEIEGLGLTLNSEKTRLLSAEKGSFDFLGFNFRKVWNREKTKKFHLMIPSHRAEMSIRKKIREITELRPVSIGEVIQRLNPVLRGWKNYFRIGNSSSIFHKIQNYIVRKIRRFIRKKQGKAGYGWKEIPNSYIYGNLGLIYDQRVKRLPV